MQAKRWYEYLWVASALYLLLGFFNILFAWLGMLCFLIPLFMALFGGNKAYCHRYCGRSQLFSLLGRNCKLSRQKPTPAFLSTKWFRYGFLAFFLTMFVLMLVQTYQVFAGRPLAESVTLLWSFHLLWSFAYHGDLLAPWVSQFAFGFYSVMLISTLLGLLSLLLFLQRSRSEERRGGKEWFRQWSSWWSLFHTDL